MNYQTLTLAVIGFAAAIGAAAVFFKRGGGMETIKLLQINLQAYKDSETLKDQEIAYLKGQLVIKEKVIEKLVSNGHSQSKRSSK